VSLAVDPVARTITGYVVPYGRVARLGGRRFRFLPGWWTTNGPVWLLRDHDNATESGRALVLTDLPAGLHVALSVRPGGRGDRMLTDAADPRFGLSVGVVDELLRDDPRDPGVRLVAHGRLREITLTDHPAFEEAPCR
jgi:hypothetical protein